MTYYHTYKHKYTFLCIIWYQLSFVLLENYRNKSIQIKQNTKNHASLLRSTPIRKNTSFVTGNFACPLPSEATMTSKQIFYVTINFIKFSSLNMNRCYYIAHKRSIQLKCSSIAIEISYIHNMLLQIFYLSRDESLINKNK